MRYAILEGDDCEVYQFYGRKALKKQIRLKCIIPQIYSINDAQIWSNVPSVIKYREKECKLLKKTFDSISQIH